MLVQLTEEPELDLEALRKAMFIEYIYHESDEYEVWPWSHQVDFDLDGNVWLAYTACCIVRFDPRTGDQTAFEGHGGGHGIAVDQTDGTVWYSGDVVRHLDPETGKVDHWVAEDRMLGSNTQIFDSRGNLWLSLLAAGALGKWDRATDSIVYWEVPVLRSRPYGIIVDHKDKVWFADYHNGGVTRFDPETEEFRHYPLVEDDAATAIRRLGVDSKGMIWAGTWGSRGFAEGLLYRVDPDTGEVFSRHMGLRYPAAYNAEADSEDNIWVSNDNYLTRYDQVADEFTHYPIPVRSDTLKTTITRDDGIWFFYRNAGKVRGIRRKHHGPLSRQGQYSHAGRLSLGDQRRLSVERLRRAAFAPGSRRGAAGSGGRPECRGVHRVRIGQRPDRRSAGRDHAGESARCRSSRRPR